MQFQRLKDLREDHDMNQKQIAEIIGTEQSYYSKYEKGKYLIPIDKLIVLADYYKVSLDYITGRTNNKEINY